MNQTPSSLGPPNIPSSVYPIDIRSHVSNPSPVGEGIVGPLDARLPGAEFQGGPTSIRDPHAGVIFLNPLPMPVSPPSGYRTGRWAVSSRTPSARELLDNPTTRNLRSALIGAGLFSTLTSLSFGFPAIGLACVGLTAFGLVISKPAKSRAAASPRLVQSSGTHSPVSPTRRANAASFFSPNMAGPLAKVSGLARLLLGIRLLRSLPPQGGSGVNRSAGTSNRETGTACRKSGAEADAVLG